MAGKLSRRTLCGAPFAIGSLQPARAQTDAVSTRKPRYIDFHHHILPPDYVSAVGRQAIGAPNGGLTPQWSVSASVDLMNRTGIESAITSITAPGIPLKDSRLVARIARGCNEFAKRMVADYPRRFGMFATLPLPNVPAAMAEIEYALDTLGADGVALHSNYSGRYLGHEHFAPVFAELNRRKALVFVHPATCSSCAGVLPAIPTYVIEFPHDTTRAITNLLYSGTFSRSPDIRFIFPHAGGTVPFLADRIARLAARDPRAAERVPEGPMAVLNRLYYDLAQSANRHAMAALLTIAEHSHILFGSDFPFAAEPVVAATVEGLRKLQLSEQNFRSIERENALSLLPRFRNSA
jgi:predicted TIM-barrel fold metal-dependent hydrolase